MADLALVRGGEVAELGYGWVGMEVEVAGAGEIDTGRRRREIGASLAPFFVRACSSLRCVLFFFFGFAPREGEGRLCLRMLSLGLIFPERRQSRLG
jgi:hypothetical protein